MLSRFVCVRGDSVHSYVGMSRSAEVTRQLPILPHDLETTERGILLDANTVRVRPMIIRLPASQPPLLSIVVDCEEEFDWRFPIRGTPYSLRSLPPLRRVAEHLAEQNAPLTIMPTYPVVEDEASWTELVGIIRDCDAAIGAHLHPWITPPFLEQPTLQNSFQGNLPPELEAAKIANLL
ncbi:MAG: hypothetical protein AB7S57_10045, partial [Acetobacteraceae bacterium]